ncbi:MAG: PASTA domain-containing protein [Dysgonamonadaceae bacterium]|nr:PASTA domain-containing protein [Dysgonamonadaceae bacterium]
MKLKTVINNIFVKNILLATFISVVLVCATLWWLARYTRHNEFVIVPDINGLQLEEAVPFLEKAGLRYEVDSIHVKNAKPGSIVESRPARGAKVKFNRIIFITLNAFSTETLIVPEVNDLSQRQALALLRSFGFESVQIKTVPSAYEDLVVGLEYNNREIRAGEKLPRSARLTLKVSSGASEEEDKADEAEMLEVSDTVFSDEP